MPNIFSSAINERHLLKHPFYQAWMAGTLKRETLKDYAAQYFHHVERFPRYLGAIHSFCEDAAARALILENLNDEEGVTHGKSHPQLWLQFAEGLGVSAGDMRATAPRAAIQKVTETFFQLARSSYAEGLGALYAYESQVPEVATSKIEGLKNRYDIHDAKTLEFFAVHETADVEHRAVIEKLLERLSPAEKSRALAAAEKAAQALWDFLSDVETVSMKCA